MKYTIEELERLASEASEGPWVVRHEGAHWVSQKVESKTMGITVEMTHYCKMREDAAFVAVSRTAIPELCAEVRRLKEVLQKIARLDYEDKWGVSGIYEHQDIAEEALNAL